MLGAMGNIIDNLIFSCLKENEIKGHQMSLHVWNIVL